MNKEINTEETQYLKKKFEEYKQKQLINNSYLMVYDNTGRINGGSSVKLIDIIRDIKSKKERDGIQKDKLSVGYFSVSGFKGRKKDVNVIKHTRMIVIDIDKKDNLELNFPELRNELRSDSLISAFFKSPSGGLKIIIRTNIKYLDHHKAFFISLKNHLQNKYPQIKKIDPSGSNIARACYLPFDQNAYLNRNPDIFKLSEEEISAINTRIQRRKRQNHSETLIDVNNITFDEHYDNMLNLLKTRTTIGVVNVSNNENNRTNIPIDNSENRTPIPLNFESERGTNVPIVTPPNIIPGMMYDNIFNELRYKTIGDILLSINVPFFEILILKNIYPNGRNNGLSYTTRLDEQYFRNNPQKPLTTDVLEGLDGLEVCEMNLSKDTIIKEGYRGKTLSSITMKLIFNNPFCHPSHILKEVMRINNYFCEDPSPLTNPKPDELEVRYIVNGHYTDFINGNLDFSRVIRKNNKNGKVSKKFVFFSSQYECDDKKQRQLDAIKTFRDGRKKKFESNYEVAIKELQDGKKITQKRIAEYMGISARNLRRFDAGEYRKLVENYNKSFTGTK